MTVERREVHTEVSSYNVAEVTPVAVSVVDPTPVTVYQTDTVVRNTQASRPMQVFKLQQVIYLLFGIVEGLLGIRFVLGLLGANPGAGFAQLIYSITAPFMAPFVGLFGQPSAEGFVLEWNALVAILVYALLAGLLVKLLALAMNNGQGDRYTTTSSRIDSR